MDKLQETSLNAYDQRLTRLETNMENFARSLRDIAETVDSIAGTQSSSGRTNWGIVLGGLGVLLSVVTAAATLQTSHLESRLAPLSLSQSYEEKRIDELSSDLKESIKELITLKTRLEYTGKQ